MKLNTKINLLSTLLTSIILVGSYTGIYFFYEKLALDTEFGQLQNHADELVMAVSTLETIDAVFNHEVIDVAILRLGDAMDAVLGL